MWFKGFQTFHVRSNKGENATLYYSANHRDITQETLKNSLTNKGINSNEKFFVTQGMKLGGKESLYDLNVPDRSDIHLVEKN